MVDANSIQWGSRGKFDDVWTWGNPLLQPPKSDAEHFETYVFYRTMATVIQRNFWRSRRAWLRILDHMQISEDHLIEVAILEREAKLQGINAAKYVANRINKSVDTVYRLFDLIDFEIASHILPMDFAEKSNFLPLDSVDTSWKPSAEDIQRKRLSVPRICAGGMPGCAETTISGNYPLCTVCAKHFPMNKQETWAQHTRDWLLPEIRRIEAEHRQRVIEILYEEHHNMVNQDVYEIAEIAA